MKRAKHTFNAVATEYERARPIYPDALIQDVLDFSQLPADGRILEIGSGTGKGTESFAGRGYTIDCVEHGSDLCEIARQKLSHDPRVTVNCAPFEDWQSHDSRFDLAISATAFHFISLEIGYPKVARLLKPNGTLAFFWTIHVPSYSDVFTQMREVYRAVAPTLDDSAFDPYGLIEGLRRTIEGTHRFGAVSQRTYSWTEEYDADRYIELLSTNSKHALLPDATRVELFKRLRATITEHGGSVTKIHLVALYLAKNMAEG